MAKCYIDFECTAQSLQRVLNDDARLNVVAANAANVILARFSLCPKWDGLAVYARFEFSHAVYDIPLEDGCAAIPWEVLKWPGFHVSLFGEDGEGGRLTSVRAFVEVERSIDWEGVPPIPSTPSLIQSFIDKAEASAKAAEELKAAAAAGEFDGEPGAPGAPGSFDNVTGVAPIACEGETIWIDSTNAEAGQVLKANGEGGAEWGEAGASVAFPIEVSQGGTGATDAATARANLDITPANIGAAAASHQHAAGDITSGTLPIERGGTGAGTAAEALGKLGAAPAVHSHGVSDIQDLQALRREMGLFSSTQELRKEMGLGDTLGALPVENMAITIVDDFEEYADYGAADGYVLSPMAGKNLGICRTGATLSFGSKSLSSIGTSETSIMPSVNGSTSNCVGVSGDTLTIEESGYYEIRFEADTYISFEHEYAGKADYITMTMKAISSALGDITLFTKVVNGTATYIGSFNGTISGSYYVFLEAGGTLSFSCSVVITRTSYVESSTAKINSLIVTLARTNPVEAATA